MAQLKNLWAFNLDPAFWADHPNAGQAVTVGHNRMVEWDASGKQLIGRLHGHPIFAAWRSGDKVQMRFDTLGRWRTFTTRQAMADFASALGAFCRISTAGGEMSIRWAPDGYKRDDTVFEDAREDKQGTIIATFNADTL